MNSSTLPLHTDFDELLKEASRPWYRYGRRSPSVLFHRWWNARQWFFRLRMASQRARRGHSDDQLWSLNYAIAKLVVAGTAYMREQANGHPMGTTPDEWDGTLEVIRLGFQDWLDGDGWLVEGSPEHDRFKNAMANLAIWFDGLWD